MMMRLGFVVASFVKRLNARSFLAMAGMAGPIVLVVTDIVAASSSKQYNIISDSISSLALTPMGYVQIIGYLAIGLLVEVYTAGLLFGVRAARGFHLSIVCLVLIGFGMLLLGAFRTDPVSVARTIEGIIHKISAGIVFWLFPAATMLITSSFRRDPYWRKFYKYTLVTSVLALVFVILVTALEESASWFGLAERFLVANMIVWVEITAIRLFMLSMGPGNR